MRLLTAWALAIGAGLLCASAAGQAPPPPPNQAGQGADDTSEGLFFTGPIIDRAIDRITEELGGHFKFDDDQNTPNDLVCAFEFSQPAQMASAHHAAAD